MPPLLDDDQLAEALATLEDWHGNGKAIVRHVELEASRMDTFLADLSVIARQLDHDPDLELRDGTLMITMSTHSAGGVTSLDVDYARRVDRLLLT